jgi:imidazolonepropionase-like amidohydrolase
VNPARALKRSQDLGKIAPGALADLIALPSSSSVREVYEQILSYTQPIPWMMLDGNVVS